ncbi:hypothetical protein [Bradyrhizobium sp. AZCC 2289]|uniref:hypothetical protein n=1 Tax=Bradyrhizobium sp. AZCC 2289 TaxID=3117026 RepID=UPI002FF20F0E
MVRDLFTIAAASVLFGVIVWFVLGDAQKRPLQRSTLQMETSHSLNDDPDLRPISERTER